MGIHDPPQNLRHIQASDPLADVQVRIPAGALGVALGVGCGQGKPSSQAGTIEETACVAA